MSEIKVKPKRTNSRTLRRFYEKETGRPVPKDFDIHHIDLDYTNNDIHNLVAIPSKLHDKYHYILNISGISSGDGFFIRHYFNDHSQIKSSFNEARAMVFKLETLCTEIASWNNFKLRLIGNSFFDEEFYESNHVNY